MSKNLTLIRNQKTQDQNPLWRNVHRTRTSRCIILGLVLSFFMLFSTNLYAQINEGFKVDWGFGYGFGGKSKQIIVSSIGEAELINTGRAGIGVYIEPRYGLNDRLTLGLRFGGDILGSGNYEDVEGKPVTVDLSISGLSSYLVTGEYNFTTNKVRPFGGLGLGLYSGESVSLGTSGLGTTKSSGLGVMPRAGVNLGHFRMILAYNMPLKKELPKYFLFTIGFEFGGGE